MHNSEYTKKPLNYTLNMGKLYARQLFLNKPIKK